MENNLTNGNIAVVKQEIGKFIFEARIVKNNNRNRVNVKQILLPLGRKSRVEKYGLIDLDTNYKGNDE